MLLGSPGILNAQNLPCACLLSKSLSEVITELRNEYSKLLKEHSQSLQTLKEIRGESDQLTALANSAEAIIEEKKRALGALEGDYMKIAGEVERMGVILAELEESR